MKLRLFLPLCTLLFISLSCQAVSSITGGGTGQGSKVLFQDSFSDSSSGWDKISTKDGVSDYANGAYRIYVNTTNTDVWSNPGLNFSDTSIQVDASKVGGVDNNDFGIICRYRDAENFYFFVISSDGYYGIGKMVNGQHKLIGVNAMPPSEKVAQGNVTNHLRADCIGNRLTFYVNGSMLADEQDTEFTSGDVGLMAGTFETPGTDIYFDNFVVSKP
jgi:hypothetical protein